MERVLIVSMDCPCTPWGEMAGKVTQDIHGLSAHPMGGGGEMAGKVTRARIQFIHGYPSHMEITRLSQGGTKLLQACYHLVQNPRLSQIKAVTRLSNDYNIVRRLLQPCMVAVHNFNM